MFTKEGNTMNDHGNPDARTARETLEGIERQRLGSDRDRSVFARVTMLGGILLGGYVGLLTATANDGTPRLLGILGFAVLTGLLLLWQNSRGATVPLGARRTARIGGVVSVVVAFVGIMVVNGLANADTTASEHQAPGALLCILLGLAVAVPAVIAGLRIGAGESR